MATIVIYSNVVKQDLKIEIKLNEKMNQQENGVLAREVLTIILDYNECRWRKVKRVTRER
jgi:hypothetical protein